MPDQESFAAEAADTIIGWHLAGTQALDSGLMTELAIEISFKLEGSPLTVSLRPTAGSLEQQLRDHLAAVLRKAFTDVPKLESTVRHRLHQARRPAAVPDDRWDDDDLDLLGSALPRSRSQGPGGASTSRRDPGPRRRRDDDD